jgi:crossover junction endodeoxyribonuclease RusA
VILDLPYPAKLLWPNGRTRSPFAKSRETKKHKAWAITAAYGDRANAPVGDRLRLIATFHCKPSGPLPDDDNASASLKAYQDGIAAALGVDDRHFGQPEVRFGARDKVGKVIIEVVAA